VSGAKIFSEGDRATLEAVLSALRELRSPFALYESDIHGWVAAQLNASGLDCRHEAVIGKGCRIDFLVEGIGIEVKKGKPSPSVVLAQLRRYAACPDIRGLVVLSQRSIRLPDTVLGVPVRVIPLSQLWGIALP
jgi:hypothetical protein